MLSDGLLFVFTWLLIPFYLCMKGKVSQFQPRLTGIRIRPYPLAGSAVLGDGFVWCSVRLSYSLYPPCFVAANYCCLGQLIRHPTFGWGVSYHSPRWQVSAFFYKETAPFMRDWSLGQILYRRNSWLTQDRNWVCSHYHGVIQNYFVIYSYKIWLLNSCGLKQSMKVTVFIKGPLLSLLYLGS